jgi:hypothetical protein
MQEETDVVFAVENMFPLQAKGVEVGMYSPHWDPTGQDYPAVTLDVSHAALSRSDTLGMAAVLGDRLAHVHLADGTGITNRDEHLVPGRGNQPCAQLLEQLATRGYRGQIVVEINTRRAIGRKQRIADLTEALAFTQLNLAARMPSTAMRARHRRSDFHGGTAARGHERDGRDDSRHLTRTAGAAPAYAEQ